MDNYVINTGSMTDEKGRSRIGRNAVPKAFLKNKKNWNWAARKLMEKAVEERKFVGFYIANVMADGDQKMFKICFTVLLENYSVE